MGIRVYGGGIFNYSGVTMFDFTTIEKGSHYVAIKKPTPAIIKALYRLGSEYTQFGHVTENKRKKWAPIKTFVVYSHGGREFRIHNGQFKRLMEIMAMMYVSITSYEITERPMYDGDDIDINILPEFKLRGQQPEAVQFIEEGGVSPLLKVPMGGGKSQPLDALVKVPDGWKKMGDIQVGDTVTAWDGTPTNVLGVYPQGSLMTYSVTFQDGRTAGCSADHLWRVYYDGDVNRSDVVETRTIREMLENGAALSIDLYHGDKDTLPPEGFEEGILIIEGSVIYRTTSASMAYAMCQWVRARGGRIHCLWGAVDGEYGYKIDHRDMEGLFRSTSLESTIVAEKGKLNSSNSLLNIVSVKPLKKKKCQCIAIDHPDHLYVTNDYVVTHNTLMSLYAAAKRKKRIAIVVLAGFVDKWVGDLQKCTDIQLNEICVVSGSDGLERSSNYPGSGLAMPKAFVISLNSVGRWLTNHEAQPDDDPLPGFSSSPDKYFEHLGVGTIIFDEVHMHPHAIYRIFSYVHVPKTIALTATLETKDPVLRKVQSTMFPKSERFDEIKMKQYIDVVACNYQIAELGRTKIRTSEYGSNSYSQTAFEKSIISDRVVYPQYMKMVIDLIRESYIDKRETGDKLIVFTGTKEMATRLLETSKRLWSTLDIRTYLEGDPFENVIVPDIRFTTVIGGGTAIDIPQLTVAIMTNSIDSPNANLQALGRLREIPGKATTFYYLYSPTLKKQRDYHESKKTLFTGRVKSHGEKMLPAIMGKPPEYERFRRHH